MHKTDRSKRNYALAAGASRADDAAHRQSTEKTMTSPIDRGAALLALHRAERGFVLPNAWDAGSAVVLASEGCAALGTTSAGIAFALGKPDYNVRDAELAVTRDEMLDAVRRIVDA